MTLNSEESNNACKSWEYERTNNLFSPFTYQLYCAFVLVNINEFCVFEHIMLHEPLYTALCNEA